MQQLVFQAPGRYDWQEARDPELSAPGQALVRPVAVACCDLDVAVAEGRLPMPPGHAVGHEGIGEVVAVGEEVGRFAVGDLVIVPFQMERGMVARLPGRGAIEPSAGRTSAPRCLGVVMRHQPITVERLIGTLAFSSHGLVT